MLLEARDLRGRREERDGWRTGVKGEDVGCMGGEWAC